MAQITVKRSSVEGKIPATTDLALGELAVNTYDGKLFLKRNNGISDTIVEIGGNQGFDVKNQTGSTILKGTAVRFAGTLGSSGKLLIAPFLADNTYPSEYFMGLVSETIVDGGDGFVIDHGKIYNIDTSAYTAGTILYASASSAGALTSTLPAAPNNKITVAAVVNSSATTGVLEVRVSIGSKLSNDELVELTSLADKNIISYNASSSRFENTNLKTVNGTSLLGTGDIVVSGGSSSLTIDNKTSAYTVVAGDLGKVINCTANSFTVTLTAAATLGAGFNCTIWNTSATSSHAITIDPNGSETIDGVATLILRRGEGLQIVCDGTNWQTGDKKAVRGYAENLSATVDRPIATGVSSIALGSSSTASGDLSLAIGLATTASSSNSTAIGRNSGSQSSQAVTGAGAMALGGSYASGTDSFAAAVANNTSSYGTVGPNSIALGYQAKCTTNYCVAIGSNTIASGAYAGALAGDVLTASGYYSLAVGGNSNTASGFCSLVTGGGGNTASGQFSVALGGQSNNASNTNAYALGHYANASLYGKYVYASGRFTSTGDAQSGTMVLRQTTTGTSPLALTADSLTPNTTNQVILPNNSAYSFSGTIVARQKASEGTASAAWRVEGLIRREGSAGTTVLVNSALTVLSNVPNWVMALTADTTNGGLAITVTGAVATNIRWVATMQTSEVTYA